MITITFKGVDYTIAYDRDTLKINQTIDSTFDNGYFESEPLSASSGLDYSRRIPRNLPVTITYDEREFYFKTGECYIQKLNYAGTVKYKHMINLVSWAKDLTKKPLENITVTQPKGDFGLYSRSVNRLDDSEKAMFELVPELSWETFLSPRVIPLTNTVNSDLTKIDGVELVALDTYTMALDFRVWNRSVFNSTVTINLKYSGVSIYTYTFTAEGGTLIRSRATNNTNTFVYSPTVAGGLLSLEITGSSAVFVSEARLSIFVQTVLDKPVRTYAQVVDKMLLRSEYVISPASRSRLSITANEDKYEEYTLYDALSKIGGYVGALVRVGQLRNEIIWSTVGTTVEDITADSTLDVSPYEYPINTVLKVGDRYYRNKETERQRREIIFEWFDSPSTFDPIGEFAKAEQAELEDYVSGVELNTKNIIKPIRYSPFRNGWKSLRSLDGLGQFTTDNIGYETEDDIEKPIQVLVKGIESRNAANTITYTLTDVTDITSRVLEKRQWDTLPSEADYSLGGMQSLLKNNTLYYIQGDNKIYGMSYVGDLEELLIGTQEVCRSLYNTVHAVRSVAEGELMSKTGTSTGVLDGGLDDDLDVQMRIKYSNLTQSRARLYKDDQSGFETELIKYFNESANVNESEAIGNYAQLIVNRLGGTKISVEGVVDSLDDIANLGDIDSLGRVYTIIELSLGKRIKYKYTLVQDYNVISSYIGIQSRHRVEEISSDSTTVRTLRYTSKFIFTDTQKTFSTRLVKSEDVLKSLLSETSDGLTYGYIEFNLSNGDTKKVHMSIDSDSKGKTIEIKWSMKDNYSAGLKRYSIVKGADTIWLNSDVPYTDSFGKVNDIQFQIFYDSLNTFDLDDYPEATTVDGSDLFVVVTDAIDKDAGEILHGLIEIPILSETDKIRVYNGFARWNKLVEGTDRIRACALEYVPVKNANKIDTTRIRDITVTGTATFGKLNIGFTLTDIAKGVAFYNIDTLDLLLAYVQDFDIGTHSVDMFYRMSDGLYGGGLNIVTQFIFDYQFAEALNVIADTGTQITGDISYDTVTALGDDAWISATVELSIGETITVEARQGRDVIDGIVVTSDVALGYDAGTSQAFSYELADAVVAERYLGLSINEGITLDSETMLGTDVAIVGTFAHDFAATLGIGLVETRTLSEVVSLVAAGTYSRVEWVSGGSAATADTTCDELSDEGNVRQTVAFSCTWVESSSYLTTADETNVSQACNTGNTRTVCVQDPFDPSVWACTVFSPDVTPAQYETCTLVEGNI